MKVFLLILMQSLRLSFRKGGGAFGSCAFYMIVVTSFTFSIGPEAIKNYATGVMCISMLLATITTLPLLFERDYEDGTMEQFMLQPVLLELLVLAKICGQWCSHIIPILAVSPLLAIMADMTAEQTAHAMLILLLASPTMVAFGAIGAALTIGSKRGGLLQALVIMPLYVPVLIFSSANGQGNIIFLTGMFLASIPLACYSCCALIRANSD